MQNRIVVFLFFYVIYLTLFAYLIILKLGGSLKRYNKIDCNWIIVSIVLPMLMFFLSMASVYSYFTATASKKESDITTAIIRVGFTDSTDASIDSDSITSSSKLIPGETLKISGAIQNIGNSDIYTILHYELFTKKEGETEIQIVDKYFTFNDSTMVEIKDISNPDDSIPSAKKLTADSLTMLGETIDFNLSHKFDFYDYDNSYQNGTVRYLITAHAIQVANLTDGSQATKLLVPLESNNYQLNFISGNSVQNGGGLTPSPTNPIEIQSVGEKTKNLFKIGTLDDYYNKPEYFTIQGNTVTGQNMPDSIAYMTNKHYYKYTPGESYTFSFTATHSTRIYVALYDAEYNNISSNKTISGLTYNGGGLAKAHYLKSATH